MKKILIVATVVKKHIMQFHVPVLKMFKDMGWETHVAAKNDYDDPADCNIPYCDKYYDVPFCRSPLGKDNIKAAKMLKGIVSDGEWSIIHCHTPVGGVLTRLVSGKARKKGTKVFYTAHGFHFYNGAPLSNWMIYYPVEKLCSYMTDVLITMNSEDYERASRKFNAKQTVMVNGVGVDLDAMDKVRANAALRAELGIKENDIILLSVGELTKRKNHKTVIQALSRINNKAVHYVIAGDGEKHNELIEMVKELGLSSQVHFLGYRRDIYSIVKASDIFCFPSYQEGLPVALMEAMAGALAPLASSIRGNVDLIDEGKGGFLYDPDDDVAFAEGIGELINNPEKRQAFALYNLEKIRQYDKAVVEEQLRTIYGEYI